MTDERRARGGQERVDSGRRRPNQAPLHELDASDNEGSTRRVIGRHTPGRLSEQAWNETDLERCEESIGRAVRRRLLRTHLGTRLSPTLDRQVVVSRSHDTLEHHRLDMT